MSIESNNYIDENNKSENTDTQKAYAPNNELIDIQQAEQVDELKDTMKDYIFGLNLELSGMEDNERNKEIFNKVSIFLDSQGDYLLSLPKEEKHKIILKFLEFGNDLKSKFEDGIITNNEIDEVLNNFITRSQ